MRTTIIIITLFIFSQSNAQFYTGKSVDNIRKEHSLVSFDLDMLNDNIKRFLPESISDNMKILLFDSSEKLEFNGNKYDNIIVTFNDTIVGHYILSEEYKPNYNSEEQVEFQKYLGIPDSNGKLIMVIKDYKSIDRSGTVFNEAAYVSLNSGKNQEYFILTLLGNSLMSPSHKQFVYLSLSTIFINKISPVLKIHESYKQIVNASDIFWSYTTDENFKKMQSEFVKPSGFQLK